MVKPLIPSITLNLRSVRVPASSHQAFARPQAARPLARSAASTPYATPMSSVSAASTEFFTPKAALETPKAPAMSRQQSNLVKRAGTMGQWGGEAELGVMAKLLGVTVQIFQKLAGGKLRRGATLNEGQAKVANLAYDGSHYSALTPPKKAGKGFFKAKVLPTPADGNCAFHALAEAAELPFLKAITEAFREGRMSDLRQDPFIMAWVDNRPPRSDVALYHELRQAYVLQMRHDLSSEMAKPAYAEMADLVALGGG